MSLREKMDQESGKRTYKTFEHPVFGKVKIRSLFEREWATGFGTWFQDANGKPIPERAVYGNVKLLQLCLMDPDSEVDTLVYTDSIADLDKLIELREEITAPLFEEAWAFNRPKNGLTPSATTTS